MNFIKPFAVILALISGPTASGALDPDYQTFKFEGFTYSCHKFFFKHECVQHRYKPENSRKAKFIEVQGGVLKKAGDMPLIACESHETVELYIEYIGGHTNENPIKHNRCWKLDEGSTVKIKQCNRFSDICEFEPRFFGKAFWTSLNNVMPR